MTTQNTTSKTHDATADSATDGLLNKWELAPKLRISKRSVDLWMQRGWLPYIKLGKSVRFRWSDVVEQLAKYRVN
jgi:predicted DNA-binding transcriptional regulator AlpA